MSDWYTIVAAANAVIQQTFGEPVVYQPVLAGQPAGDPVTIVAVRQNRVREEAGATANFEEISVNPSDFGTPPAKGDWVVAWGTQYAVTTVRQPDPCGMVILTLQQRAGQALP